MNYKKIFIIWIVSLFWNFGYASDVPEYWTSLPEDQVESMKSMDQAKQPKIFGAIKNKIKSLKSFKKNMKIMLPRDQAALEEIQRMRVGLGSEDRGATLVLARGRRAPQDLDLCFGERAKPIDGAQMPDVVRQDGCPRRETGGRSAPGFRLTTKDRGFARSSRPGSRRAAGQPSLSTSAAWAAARRAIGTRNGEQLT